MVHSASDPKKTTWPSILPDTLRWLRFSTLTFLLESCGETRLPEFLGSTLRGGLAMAFRKKVCTENRLQCDGCPVQEVCLYPSFFETPSATGSQSIRRMRDLPHPILIHPPLDHRRSYRTGDTFSFGITLLGNKVSAFSDLISTVAEMARHGIGAERTPFTLKEVSGSGGKRLPRGAEESLPGPAKVRMIGDVVGRSPGSKAVKLNLITPLRVRVQGKLMNARFQADPFFRTLCRRLWAILTAHENVPEGSIDFRPLFQEVPLPVVTRSALRWKHQLRYSNRQKKKIGIGGLVGAVYLSEVAEPWWILLQAASVVGVGKGTVMGLGRIRMEAVATGEGSAPEEDVAENGR